MAEVAAKVYEQSPTIGKTPHPTQPQDGESLPVGFSRSYAGFLLCKQKRIVKVDQDIIKQEMDYLERFIVIVGFVGSKPSD